MLASGSLTSEAYRLANEYAMEEKQMARESLKSLEKFEKDLIQFKNDPHMIVLYISGGINSAPGRQYYDLIERRPGDTASLSMTRESGSDLWSLLRKIVAQLNRHNITFYTINTRGNESPLPDSVTERNRKPFIEDGAYLDDTQELMAEIADLTGGLYFENSLNFGHGFDLILSDLDHQYLICYKAPGHKKPNEFHKIKVESKKSGIKLRHRSGYLD
jgi:VWFA-related protein